MRRRPGLARKATEPATEVDVAGGHCTGNRHGQYSRRAGHWPGALPSRRSGPGTAPWDLPDAPLSIYPSPARKPEEGRTPAIAMPAVPGDSHFALRSLPATYSERKNKATSAGVSNGKERALIIVFDGRCAGLGTAHKGGGHG